MSEDQSLSETIFIWSNGKWYEFGKIAQGADRTPGVDPSPGPQIPPPPHPSLTLYSQRDPRWKDLIYAGDKRHGTDGCYVSAVAMILSLAGYADSPVVVAEKLRNVGAFSGAFLSKPEKIPDAYPLMRYDGPFDVSRDGPLRWHDGSCDLPRFMQELESGPLIMEVDFKHQTQEFNQHFVVAVRALDEGRDILIADPWDGTETRLMQRYAGADWDLKRTIYGVRLLRVK